MRTWHILLAAALPCAAQTSARFDLSWSTIDGGGGTSTGGVFQLSGTIGQPDAANSAGGNFALTGGFWGIALPVQQDGAPTLRIVNLLSGNVHLSWSPNTLGFTLEVSPALHGLPGWWTPAPAAYTNGATVPASMQARFFRLRRN
jgi:hypothetical protein